MISKKIPFDELSSKDRITVLEWMIDGIHSALEQIVKSKTHAHFLLYLHRDKDFSPDDLWKSLGESSQSHFDHAKKAIDMLEKRIDSELVGSVEKKAPVKPAPAPERVVTKQSKKKKGK